MVEHSAIPNVGLHEPKGASTALNRQVYRADGLGSGNWEGLQANLAQGSISGNATATTITTAGLGNEVIVNFGTSVLNDSAIGTGFSVTSAGRFTYTGSVESKFLVSAQTSSTIGAGSNQLYGFYVGRNGVALAPSLIKVDISSTAPAFSAISHVVELDTNDYVELYVVSLTGTEDITVESASVSVTQVGA